MKPAGFTDSASKSRYHDYICHRKCHRIQIPHDRRELLREFQSDPTLGDETLDLLCSACNAVGTAILDPTPKVVPDNGSGSCRDVSIGYRKMRCVVETCKSRRLVFTVHEISATPEDIREAFLRAEISNGFCCPAGHRIQRAV